jgi:hypothetical protein
MNQSKDSHWYQAEFGTPFKNLPLRLMKRWWETTCYGKHPATNELMWTIEAIDPEAAKYIALGDAERTEQTMGKKKISDQTTEAEYLLKEEKALFACMFACGDESAGQHTKDICRDMVKVVMAWRRGNHSPPRWELPALMGPYKKGGIIPREAT